MSFRNSMIRLPGKIKGVFFVCRMDRIVPLKLFSFLAHLAALSKWISKINKISTCPGTYQLFCRLFWIQP